MNLIKNDLKVLLLYNNNYTNHIIRSFMNMENVEIVKNVENVDRQKHTRFPPEPNGYLHLGHLKAMMFDFATGNHCILRMDDTNPETEKEEYVNSIIEDTKWLGFNPIKITATSDYFDYLFEAAKILIKADKAYVDLTKPDEIKQMRHAGLASEFRDSSKYNTDWHLNEFLRMQNGEYSEGTAVLRLKIDMKNVNHTLRDPIAYRVKFANHYRTKDKWRVYPSYDYSHGIVDALEEITDSFCTMEFYVRREQYYWPVLRLNEILASNSSKTSEDAETPLKPLIPAVVKEFGRLNVENNLLSKRKIIELVKNNSVTGFDDPRLLTIRGLRRRGFTPEILKAIVGRCSDSRQDNVITQSLIDYHLREVLDQTSIRVFGVLDPIELEIVDHKEDRDCNHPHVIDETSHNTRLTKNVYIERADFKEQDEKGYFRLAPGKTIRLRYADFLEYLSHNHTNNDTGSGITDNLEIKAEIKVNIQVKNAIPVNPKKIKGVIHWTSTTTSFLAKFEQFDDLLENGVFNPNSKTCYKGYVENYVLQDLNKTYQFERVGYYKFDRYDEDGIPVFIRVVKLVDKYKPI